MVVLLPLPQAQAREQVRVRSRRSHCRCSRQTRRTTCAGWWSVPTGISALCTITRGCPSGSTGRPSKRLTQQLGERCARAMSAVGCSVPRIREASKACAERWVGLKKAVLVCLWKSRAKAVDVAVCRLGIAT